MKKIFATLLIMATMAIMLPVAASAQTSATRRVYRDGRWQTVRVTTTNRGNHYGWTKGKHHGWRNRTNGITPQEQERLARERMRLGNLQNRVARDGVITHKEAGKLEKRADKYERRVNKARNN